MAGTPGVLRPRPEHRPDSGVRARAWFGLAQTGAAGAEPALKEALRDEHDAEVRTQVIFALSQLPDPRGVDALNGLVADDALTREDRKQAMFWLAQSESERAADYFEGVFED